MAPRQYWSGAAALCSPGARCRYTPHRGHQDAVGGADGAAARSGAGAGPGSNQGEEERRLTQGEEERRFDADGGGPFNFAEFTEWCAP